MIILRKTFSEIDNDLWNELVKKVYLYEKILKKNLNYSLLDFLKDLYIKNIDNNDSFKNIPVLTITVAAKGKLTDYYCDDGWYLDWQFSIDPKTNKIINMCSGD